MSVRQKSSAVIRCIVVLSVIAQALAPSTDAVSAAGRGAAMRINRYTSAVARSGMVSRNEAAEVQHGFISLARRNAMKQALA